MSDPLFPPEWDTLSPLLDEVLDAPPDQRTALIDRLTGGDTVRRDALRKLVAECERDLPLLDRSAGELFGGLAEDDAPLLPPVVADRYEIGRELGRGGMARVYLARDKKHGRDVAIKVLRAELSKSLGHDRFLREIEIAARLRHPNIVPLYDSGEQDGALYFVMPCEAGPSLRERLRTDGPLPLTEALGVLRDVARALGYAHDLGLVHRDVKPDNVMLSSGAAIVTDFGIAKAVTAALSDELATEITQTGAAIGTPAYMAPEQVSGDPSIDHRADLYAYGCLAYEVLTGHPPFYGLSTHQIVAAHLTTVPELVSAVRTDVPPPIAALVARCLEKDPGNRPQSAREILAVLDAAPPASGAWPAAAPTTRRVDQVAHPQRSNASPRRWIPVALALVAVLVAAGYFALGSGTPAKPISIAVLPFYNSGDSTMDFVAEGLADDVAGTLARVPGIEIRSRSGARLYRGQLSPNVTEAGSRLNADYVMYAVIRQDRARWILSANLDRAADATSIWGENFHIGSDEEAGAAEAITRSLIAALRSDFPGVGFAPATPSNRRTTDADANRLYLRGIERLSRRGQSVGEAADLFRAAIQRDSLYGQAWAGLSLALAFFPHFQGASVAQIRDEVQRAARRALALDSTLAAPHTALGLLYQFELQWERAEREHQAAVRLEPQNVEASIQYARHLGMRGRSTEALRWFHSARAQDPASAVMLSNMSHAYLRIAQVDSAVVEARRALETDPENLTSAGLGAIVMLEAGYPDSARRLVSRIRSWSSFPPKAYVLAKAGDSTAVRQALRDLEGETPQPWMAETRRAFSYLGLGDTASALTALERATDRGEIWTSISSPLDPVYRSILGSRRYRDLLRRVGLTDALAHAPRSRVN